MPELPCCNPLETSGVYDRGGARYAQECTVERVYNVRHGRMTGRPHIILVACARGKKQHAVTAGELYQSVFLSKSRKYAEATDRPWYILSTKHGLLHPRTVIELYDESLNHRSAAARRAWSATLVLLQ